MFGFRTPTKNTEDSAKNTSPQSAPNVIEKAGPSTNKEQTVQVPNVRKSIGEWETGQVDTLAAKQTSPKKVAPLTRQKQKTALTQEAKGTVRKAVVEVVESSPKVETNKYVDRLTEARACLHKAKLHLNNSRNLKNDIKIEVTQAIERLYQLVKETEKGKSTVNEEKLRDQGKKEEILDDKNRKRKEEDQNIIKKLEEHGKLLEESKKEMEKLREEIKKQESKEDRATYASIVAGPQRVSPPENTAMHSVIITSSDEKETGDQVMDKIRKVMNAKEEGLKIDKIRKARDRKIIVGCRTEMEINRVKERLKMAGKDLNVDEIKNKDPLIILMDVLQYNTDADIQKAIQNQNKHLLQDIPEKECRMEVKYRKRTRNPLTSHIVLRVSPQIWSRLTQAGVIHVDLQRVRVMDQSPLVQCSRCLGYGHSKRICNETTDVCSHCGGPHMKTECANWLAGGTPDCKNCNKAKLEKREHNAFSGECPVRKKWEILARSTVAYC